MQRVADVVHHDGDERDQTGIVGIAGGGFDDIERRAGVEQIAHQLHGVGAGDARVNRAVVVIFQLADGEVIRHFPVRGHACVLHEQLVGAAGFWKGRGEGADRFVGALVHAQIFVFVGQAGGEDAGVHGFGKSEVIHARRG